MDWRFGMEKNGFVLSKEDFWEGLGEPPQPSEESMLTVYQLGIYNKELPMVTIWVDIQTGLKWVFNYEKDKWIEHKQR